MDTDSNWAKLLSPMGRISLVIILGASTACSASGNGSAADASTSTTATVGVDSGLSCNVPLSQRPPNSTCVLEANGVVEDLATGAPLGDRVMTFCGTVCYGTSSDDAGTFTIPVGAFVDTGNYAMHADGRPDHAVDYLRFAKGAPTIITATMRLPALPPSQVLLPPDDAGAASVTEGDLTLVVAAGNAFDLDIEDYGTTAGRTLRVASVPIASAPSYARAANLEAIYALAPSGATASIKMGVQLKNSAQIPAGTAVEFLVLGDDYFSVPPNVGTLSVTATGHVSADGKTIQTDPGEGINELTWLGVRRKGN